jgi:hypothetical protein
MLVTETPAYEQAINYCKKNIRSVASIFFRLDFILHDHFFGVDPRSVISQFATCRLARNRRSARRRYIFLTAAARLSASCFIASAISASRRSFWGLHTFCGRSISLICHRHSITFDSNSLTIDMHSDGDCERIGGPAL